MIEMVGLHQIKLLTHCLIEQGKIISLFDIIFDIFTDK